MSHGPLRSRWQVLRKAVSQNLTTSVQISGISILRAPFRRMAVSRGGGMSAM